MSIFVQTFILYNDDDNNNNNNNNNDSNNNDNDNNMFFIKYPLLITTLTIKIYLQLICFFKKNYSVKALFTISIKKLFSSSIVL